MIGDGLIATAKTLAIQETTRTIIHLGMFKIIVKSDFQVVIKSILGQLHIAKQISNRRHKISCKKIIRNTRFSIVTGLDKLVKNEHLCNTPTG